MDSASKARLNWYFESVEHWCAMAQTDKDWSTHRCPSSVPHFVRHFCFQLDVSFASLVERQNAIRFDAIRCFDFYRDIWHIPILGNRHIAVYVAECSVVAQCRESA